GGPELFERTLRRRRRIAVELEFRRDPVLASDEHGALQSGFDFALVAALGSGCDDGNALELRELLLDLGQILSHEDGIDLRALGVLVGEDDELVGARLGEAGADGAAGGLVALPVRDEPRSQCCEERQVAGEHAELAVDARSRHFVDARREGATARRDDLELDLVSHGRLVLAHELLALLLGLGDVADHVERLLGELVELALDDLFEAVDRLLEWDVLAVGASEPGGHEERLRQEALDLPRAGDHELVLFAQLVHAENGDDVLQVLVLLEDRLDLTGDVVVTLPHDGGVEQGRGRVERIDGRVDADLGQRAAEDRGRVEVGDRRGRRRIGEVVGGHVDGLDARDGALVRRRDALLERAHLGGERWLVTDRARDPAEEGRRLGAGLREAEDVVDEEEDVLLLLVAEVLGHGERAERDASSGAGRFVHLPVDEGGLADDRRAALELRLRHLDVEVVAFARALADAGEAAHAAVSLGDVVDELLNENRLADAGAAEKADFAALPVR